MALYIKPKASFSLEPRVAEKAAIFYINVFALVDFVCILENIFIRLFFEGLISRVGDEVERESNVPTWSQVDSFNLHCAPIKA